MIVFRDAPARAESRAVHARLRALALRADDDGLLEGLIVAGQLESALVDGWCPEVDEPDPRIAGARAITRAFARALVRGEPVARWADESAAWPDAVRLGVPEGYAWYGLDPRAYVAAVRRIRGPVVVVGLRGIGTSLAAMVHEALAARGVDVASFTVRPRGHPLDRRVVLGRRYAAQLGRARRVLVVDEGPGLSGSSLAGAAEAIGGCGVDDGAIVLLPAHLPDPATFPSPAVRQRWARHDKLALPSVLPPDLVAGEDWSHGRWRRGRDVPADPRYERLKRRIPDGVARFVGLPPFDGPVVERARALAEAGIGPPVVRAGGGALVHAAIATVGPLEPEGLLAAVIRRLEHARARPADGAVDLREMVEVNLAQAGIPVPDLAALGDGSPVEIDGRLDLHEWIRGPSGVVKVDGVEHGDDHFFPGPVDLAWDVAAVGVELGALFEQRALAALADPGLGRRVPAYRAAYAAFRLGRAHLALGGADLASRAGWEREVDRYRAALIGQ